MAWQQFSIITDEETAPKIAAYLEKQGAVSVTYMDAEDEPVYEPAIGETKIWTNTQVVALYELDIDIERVKINGVRVKNKWGQSKIKSLSILSSTYSLSVVTIFKPVIWHGCQNPVPGMVTA